MSGLSRVDILAEIQNGRLSVDPFDAGAVQPASLDLRLGNTYLELIDGVTLDAHKDNSGCFHKNFIVSRLVLQPGKFILAETAESVSLGAGLVSHLSGRSSLGRLGVLVHVTAGVVDPGWSGKLTLEIMNVTHGPVVLYPGDRVAQLTFQYLLTPTTGYAGKYQGAEGPQASRMFQDV